MKIHHNMVTYLIPIILACCVWIPTSPDASSTEETGFQYLLSRLIISAFIILLCWVNYRTRTLELKNNIVQGKRGLIRRFTISTAVSNISYCEYKRFLIFNRIRIDAITGHYVFKNMKQAKEFTELVNQNQGR